MKTKTDDSRGRPTAALSIVTLPKLSVGAAPETALPGDGVGGTGVKVNATARVFDKATRPTPSSMCGAVW